MNNSEARESAKDQDLAKQRALENLLGPDLVETVLDIYTECRFTTESSVWLIRPDRYCRLPRTESPHPVPESPALVRGVWHDHVGVWMCHTGAGDRLLRIMPPGRGPSAVGVLTGCLVEYQGPPLGWHL